MSVFYMLKTPYFMLFRVFFEQKEKETLKTAILIVFNWFSSSLKVVGFAYTNEVSIFLSVNACIYWRRIQVRMQDDILPLIVAISATTTT